MVVKPTKCCGALDSISEMFNVYAIETMYARCIYCGDKSKATDVVQRLEDGTLMNVNLDRVIKIDPLSEPESITKDEEVPA